MIGRLVSKILFKNKPRTKFIPVRLSPAEVEEKVFLGGKDITWQHCIVCHDPFFMAVWSNEGLPSEGTVQIKKDQKLRAEVEVKRKQTVGDISVYEILKSRCYQLPYWHQYILQKRYFLYKKKDTFLQGMIYAAMYSFPRRVITVSYKDESYFNIFPMDFQCFVESAGVLILGLRTTNTTLKKILASGKVVVSDTTSVDIKTIYDLGRNHSSAPPAVDQLPFGVIKSESFGFYVPEFSASYMEVEIVNHVELGTHTMMVGRMVTSKKLREDRTFIHHVHFFEGTIMDFTLLPIVQ